MAITDYSFAGLHSKGTRGQEWNTKCGAWSRKHQEVYVSSKLHAEAEAGIVEDIQERASVMH